MAANSMKIRAQLRGDVADVRIKGAKAGDKLVVSWVDNKDDKDSAQVVVTAPAA